MFVNIMYFSLIVDECPTVQLNYGEVKISGTKVGDIAQLGCLTGFLLSGSQELQCLTTGNWSGNKPECIRKKRVKLLLT